VKLLLDTHVVLWWRLDSGRLTRTVRQRIATADVVWVSAASGWEAAIKQGLGKLRLADSFSWMVEDSDFDELPVTLRHAEQVAILPPHHADPFDRMLIAQARAAGATIVTHDPQFERYDVPVVRV
jgi:PIN domain nuclease of toxin-antitoxin system